MNDSRRIGFVGCAFLIMLRMTIGWQFLYEGLWKYNKLETAKPWSAEPYLKNAQGPFRKYFRDLTDDPDDLNWLDYEKMSDKWDDWHKVFIAHYGLTEKQQETLRRILKGREQFVAELDQLPVGVEFQGDIGDIVNYDAKRKRLIVDGEKHLTPDERNRLLKMVTVEENPSEENRAKNEIAKKYQKAVSDVYKRSARLSFDEKLKILLKGDPDRVGRIWKDDETDEIVETQTGEITLYKQQLERFEEKMAKVAQINLTFEFNHLKQMTVPGYGDLQQLRSKVVGPVKVLEADLKREAVKLLDQQQLAIGPVSELITQMSKINNLTIWSLIVLGGLLIAGFCSRLSAFVAAGLLLSFYLAMPPWPGIAGIQALPGPEHSLIVNKNLIEVIALLAIAALPTGKWFGIDALFGGRPSPQPVKRTRRQTVRQR